MFNKNLDYLLKKAAASAPTALSQCSGTVGTYSFGIVNSKSNGKRITLSKSLGNALNLENAIEFMAVPEEGTLLISKAFPEGTAIQCELKGDSDDQRKCYNTSVVKALIKDFQLDFDGRTSRSFNKISIDKSGNVPVAIVTLSAPFITESGESA